MKKITLIFLTTIMIFSLIGCKKTIKGTDQLIEKAREEVPISDADTMEINYAGQYNKDGNALIWFVSGNEYQAHYYLPMECKILEENEYEFVRTYKPIDRWEDIAVLNWKGGYCFLINNPNCSTVKITDNSGTHEVLIENYEYPYVFYNKLLPTEYLFLDTDGNEI